MAIDRHQYDRGYIQEKPVERSYKFMKINDTVHEIHTVNVHEFTVGDVEDPILYAAGPLLDWENSEKGQWVLERAVESPIWHQTVDYNRFGFQFYITAKLKAVDYTFWMLKWGSKIT